MRSEDGNDVVSNSVIPMGGSSVDVSVVVPVFGTDPGLLSSCLSSIACQDNDGVSFECLVIFDGEPEVKQRDVVRRFEESEGPVRSTIIRHAGVSSARNAGIVKSVGEWILFVDADDFLPRHALSSLWSFATSHRCDIVQGSYVSKFGKSEEVHSYLDHPQVFVENDLLGFCKDVLNPDRGVSMAWGKLYRRQLLISSSIQFDTRLSIGEDTTFVFDVVTAACVIGYISEVVYVYVRNRSSSISIFHQDFVDCINITLGVVRNKVVSLADAEEYMTSYWNFVLFHLLLIQQHYIFNPGVLWNDKKRKQIYLSVLSADPYRSALMLGKTACFVRSKRIAIFALRFKCYLISKVISSFRNRQIF